MQTKTTKGDLHELIGCDRFARIMLDAFEGLTDIRISKTVCSDNLPSEVDACDHKDTPHPILDFPTWEMSERLDS